MPCRPGKGGVGKSTTTANLALALAAEGARVGILDADIYGPSQPSLMGISEKPTSSDGKNMDPIIQYGLQLMSIGFMMDSVQPLAWRAPMITQAVMQLLQQTKWQDLDYLLIDMPPGTGDIQLTLSQKAPLTGAIVVTTPQDVAVLDARKGLMMFQKMNVDVLGIVENMSSYVCSHCGQIEHIFGKDGGKLMSEAYGVDSLGEIPLNIAVREQTDNGKPGCRCRTGRVDGRDIPGYCLQTGSESGFETERYVRAVPADCQGRMKSDQASASLKTSSTVRISPVSVASYPPSWLTSCMYSSLRMMPSISFRVLLSSVSFATAKK